MKQSIDLELSIDNYHLQGFSEQKKRNVMTAMTTIDKQKRQRYSRNHYLKIIVLQDGARNGIAIFLLKLKKNVTVNNKTCSFFYFIYMRQDLNVTSMFDYSPEMEASNG